MNEIVIKVHSFSQFFLKNKHLVKMRACILHYISYIKSYLEFPKSLGPLEHYMKLKE